MSVTLVRRLLVTLAAVLLLLVAVFVGMRLISDMGAEAGGRRGSDQASAIPVEVAAVRRGNIEEHLRLAGSLVAAEEFALAAEVSARLNALSVDIGDSIKRGAVVARLESEDFKQHLQQAQAAVQIADAELARARSQVDVKKRAASRYQQLLKRGIATEAETDEAEAARLDAVAAVAVTEAQLARARADLQAAELALADTEIAAVWDGEDDERLVGERWVDVGEHLQAGQNIISVIRIDPLKAAVYVSEQHYAMLAVRQAATIQCDAYADKIFTAEVTRLSPRFDASSRQARVELRVDNPDHLLKPGMFIRVELVINQAEDVLLVPETALISRGGDAAIFIADSDQIARQVNVTVGIRDQGLMQVSVDGDQDIAGSQVITLGQHLLTDKSPIRIAAD